MFRSSAVRGSSSDVHRPSSAVRGPSTDVCGQFKVLRCRHWAVCCQFKWFPAAVRCRPCVGNRRRWAIWCHPVLLWAVWRRPWGVQCRPVSTLDHLRVFRPPSDVRGPSGDVRGPSGDVRGPYVSDGGRFKLLLSGITCHLVPLLSCLVTSMGRSGLFKAFGSNH